MFAFYTSWFKACCFSGELIGLEKAVYHFPSYPRLCVTVKVFVEVPDLLFVYRCDESVFTVAWGPMFFYKGSWKTSYFKVQLLGVFAFRKGREKRLRSSWFITLTSCVSRWSSAQSRATPANWLTASSQQKTQVYSHKKAPSKWHNVICMYWQHNSSVHNGVLGQSKDNWSGMRLNNWFTSRTAFLYRLNREVFVKIVVYSSECVVSVS